MDRNAIEQQHVLYVKDLYISYVHFISLKIYSFFVIVKSAISHRKISYLVNNSGNQTMRV